MASNNRETRKSKFPRFIKIFLQETLAQGRVAIPTRFARKYGNDLGDKVFLQVPSGSVWTIELANCDDALWLQNGWREFEEYYSLAHGSFLIFEYRGNNFFYVFILDKSAAEIAYPYDDNEPQFGKENKDAKTERNADDSSCVEIQDDCLPSSKTRKKSPLPCPQSPKEARKSIASKPESKSSVLAKRGNKGVCCRKQKKSRIHKDAEEVLRDDENTKAFHRAYSVNKSNDFKNSRRYTSRTLDKAAGFKSNHPSFVVVVKPADVYRSSVNIPFNFAANHLKPNNITLQISKRKTWTVRCLIYSEHAIARLSNGWPAFVRDNNLKTGAKCVFKLVDRAELVLNVVILRASEDKITRLPELTEKFRRAKTVRSTEDSCEGRVVQRLSGHKHKLSNKHVRTKLTANDKANALLKAIAAFQPAYPYFTRHMQPSYIQKRLDIPFPFAKSHFKDYCEIVLHNMDGRTWSVRCRVNNDRRQAYFICGWNDFARDNNLKTGSFCVFELIKTAELLLKVSIFRARNSQPPVGQIRINRAKVVESNKADPQFRSFYSRSLKSS